MLVIIIKRELHTTKGHKKLYCVALLKSPCVTSDIALVIPHKTQEDLVKTL